MGREIDPLREYRNLLAAVISARRGIEQLKDDAGRILTLMDATPQYFRFGGLDPTGLPPLGHCSIVYPIAREWPTAEALQRAFIGWHAAGARLTAAWEKLSADDRQIFRGVDPSCVGPPVLR